MIPAIDPGIGLKEDGPAPRVSQSGNPAPFSKALKPASGPSQTQPSRSLENARAAGDTRARQQYGKAADEAREARQASAARSAANDRRNARKVDDSRPADARGRPAPTQHARKADAPGTAREGEAADADATPRPEERAEGSGDLQAAAQQATNVAVQPAVGQAPMLAGAVDETAVEALALAAVASGEKQAVAADATPITAQFGAAAYRMGVHGKGEAEAAGQQGVVLPGTPMAELQGRGVHDARLATLQDAEPADVELHLERPLGDASGLLKPSDPGAKPAKGLSVKEQIALQTAQARNDVLSRLAVGSGGEAEAGDAAGTSAGDALRQQLQFSGLLARNAHAKALEPAAPGTPPASVNGIGTPATAPDLTQVYETPQDDAARRHAVDRVANEARWLIRSDRQEVTFRLSPEHLGSVHMKVQHKDGVFRVDVTVDNYAAKSLLEANVQDLRNRLAGEHPGGEFLFNVDVRQGRDQSGMYARAQQAPPTGIARLEGLEPAPTPGLAGRTIGQSGLSIYV